MEEGVEEIPLGLYLVKGDMMCARFLLFVKNILSDSPAALSSAK